MEANQGASRHTLYPHISIHDGMATSYDTSQIDHKLQGQQLPPLRQILQVQITTGMSTWPEGNTMITLTHSMPHSDSQSDIKKQPVTSSSATTTIQTSVEHSSSTDSYMQDFINKYAFINNDKEFRCLICKREFTQKGNLKTHVLTHIGPTERPYNCDTCGRRFTQKGNRDIHKKIHTGTKDHTCPYCDRGFTQRGNLKTHIRSVHTGEKPYSCAHCGKAFSQKANMLTHFRTHDKNLRFSCNVCGKTFSQKGNLKTHQQRHTQASKTLPKP